MNKRAGNQKVRKLSVYLLASFMPVAGAFAVAFPTQHPTPMSQSGMIQNVHNYSSNPFWSPDSPYNQRMPVPVYAQGTSLNASDCQNIVMAMIITQCANRDNCIGARLSDIRPAIMIQLSKMPGDNYVTACSGFLDNAFNDYMTQNGYATGGNNFPNAIIPGSNASQGEKPTIQMENPYKRQLPQWHGDEWYKEIIERATELENLQSQNGVGNERLARASMPTTAADLSFVERTENARAGYEPWANNNAYVVPHFETDEEMWQRKSLEARAKQTYCQSQRGVNTQVLDQDLATLRKCKLEKKRIEDCRPLLRGQY